MEEFSISWSNNLNVFLAKHDGDLQIRIDTIKDITDEDMLKDIFENDSVTNVRILAMHQIKDIDFLLDACSNNPNSHIRLAILNRIFDESLLNDEDLSLLLEKILLNDPDSYVLRSALQKANFIKQDVLIEVAENTNDELVKRQAIKKITDENILMDYALNDSNEHIRLEAIQNPNLKNIDAILNIIIAEKSEFNRLMAIYKIPDCESLIKIVYQKPLYPYLDELAQNIIFPTNDYFLNDFKQSADDYERQVDVLFIEDKGFLEDLFLNETNDEIKAFAIKNRHFNNQDILENIVKTQSSQIILSQAVFKIENQEILIDYVKNHLQYCDVTVRAISRVDDLEFLEELSTNDDSRIRFEAVKRISNLNNSNYLLKKVALTESNEEICLKAISAMDNRNDLIEIADFRAEKTIRVQALKKIKAKRLLYNLIRPIQTSISDLPFEYSLKEMALNDDDLEIRRIATSKLDDVLILKQIASREDVNSKEAHERLDALFEDIKSIENPTVLDKLIKYGDEDVSNMARDSLNDLSTWQERISQINDISDIEVLKEISKNDFNYFVRSEAEGKLENLLFNIRLDEISTKENQEKLMSIAKDESFSDEIRKIALLKITDKEFVDRLK